MKRGRLKTKAGGPHIDDLSFPPPYCEQAKYLALANKFLSMNGSRRNLQTDKSKHFKDIAKKKKAA
jgi:hypothetical protein